MRDASLPRAIGMKNPEENLPRVPNKIHSFMSINITPKAAEPLKKCFFKVCYITVHCMWLLHYYYISVAQFLCLTKDKMESWGFSLSAVRQTKSDFLFLEKLKTCFVSSSQTLHLYINLT